MSIPSNHVAHRVASCREDQELCTRIEAEFKEMPGLKLTVKQASRLFDIEPARCERVLEALVERGHLATDGRAFGSPRVEW
jgi:hypothetical protein